MTALEQWSQAAGIAGVAINFVLFVGFFIQLRELRRQVDLSERAVTMDHDRRRKQATIEFYLSTLEKREASRGVLPYDRDSEAISELLERAEEENELLNQTIAEYLALFEPLATGVATEVFDLDALYRVAGGPIREIFNNYYPWITRRRNLYNTAKLYEQLELLVAKFAELRAASSH